MACVYMSSRQVEIIMLININLSPILLVPGYKTFWFIIITKSQWNHTNSISLTQTNRYNNSTRLMHDTKNQHRNDLHTHTHGHKISSIPTYMFTFGWHTKHDWRRVFARLRAAKESACTFHKPVYAVLDKITQYIFVLPKYSTWTSAIFEYWNIILRH